MKPVTSAANPAYRTWLRLAQQPREHRLRGRTLAEGVHLARAALDAGTVPQAWIVRRGTDTAAGEMGLVSERLRRLGTPAFELAASLYDRLAPVEHGSGLLLVVASRNDPLPHASRDDLAYFDGIQDPGNVGTMLRVAAAAGLRHVLGGPGCASFWSPKALRAGMGAQFVLRMTENVGAADLAATLDGPWIACAAHDADSLWAMTLPSGALGWVFGAEGRGISHDVAEVCSRRVTIPIAAGVESLNVATAAAVCLFERRRVTETG